MDAILKSSGSFLRAQQWDFLSFTTFEGFLGSYKQRRSEEDKCQLPLTWNWKLAAIEMFSEIFFKAKFTFIIICIMEIKFKPTSIYVLFLLFWLSGKYLFSAEYDPILKAENNLLCTFFYFFYEQYFFFSTTELVCQELVHKMAYHLSMKWRPLKSLKLTKIDTSNANCLAAFADVRTSKRCL